MPKLLITDLDNTLYDWVSYFSQSFEVLVDSIVDLTGIDKSILLRDFKDVHQKYNSSERPFATLEVKAIVDHYGTSDKEVLKVKLAPAFQKFSEKRKETLRLYDGVTDTLAKLRAKGVKVVGHTESYEVNAVYRAKKLGLDLHLQHLYTIGSNSSSHPDKLKPMIDPSDVDWVIKLPEEERKPNPRLVLDICEREGVSPTDTYYIGDSIVKDMSMANAAGVNSVWAKYGKDFQSANWKLLVSITHWTDEDVRIEEDLKTMYSKEKPLFEVSSFAELQDIILECPN
ncbi:HAD family hydrolase [Vibrio anguillarum]|uniref:HAD family hydrolase n=2 Tax=Vibrio anguillarum TaxID=55601 RepID=UPI00188B63B2|nr:HAD family hydrolase [Vibrio anguillarum]MBF4277005.1 HAD family hydrolase [Vibrio anguillarum]MBF4363106.1 HAD family hydrolase [Vibrio anguillarum]